MAPSRALFRTALAVHHRASSSLLSTACRIGNQQASPISSYSRPTNFENKSSIRHSPIRRPYSQDSKIPEPPDYLSEGELHVFNKIKAELEPIKLEVQDISGGCGSMYALEIESAKFKGLSVIKQHKLVNSVLADEIKSWHGVQLRTKAA